MSAASPKQRTNDETNGDATNEKSISAKFMVSKDRFDGFQEYDWAIAHWEFLYVAGPNRSALRMFEF